MKTIVKKGMMILLTLSMVLGLVSCKSSDYKKAQGLFEAEEYQEAKTVFIALGDYQDSKEYVNKCNYQLGIAALKGKSYEEAASFFSGLEDYEDSASFLVRAKWGMLYSYVQANGKNPDKNLTAVNEDFGKWISTSVDKREIGLEMPDPETIILHSVTNSGSSGFLMIVDFAPTIKIGDTLAIYRMAGAVVIGSANTIEMSAGTFNTDTIKRNEKLVPSSFSSSMKRVDGTTVTSSDASSAFYEPKEYWATLANELGGFLKSTGVDITTKDLGFSF